MKQQQLLHDNASVVKERERENNTITRSIVEINQWFKDLTGFIIDQGTLLDRIDFNVEQATVRVKSALWSAKQAEEYQKRSLKMYCIFVLAVCVVADLFYWFWNTWFDDLFIIFGRVDGKLDYFLCRFFVSGMFFLVICTCLLY